MAGYGIFDESIAPEDDLALSRFDYRTPPFVPSNPNSVPAAPGQVAGLPAILGQVSAGIQAAARSVADIVGVKSSYDIARINQASAVRVAGIQATTDQLRAQAAAAQAAASLRGEPLLLGIPATTWTILLGVIGVAIAMRK